MCIGNVPASPDYQARNLTELAFEQEGRGEEVGLLSQKDWQAQKQLAETRKTGTPSPPEMVNNEPIKPDLSKKKKKSALEVDKKQQKKDLSNVQPESRPTSPESGINI